MDRFVINGGKPLAGSVTVEGSKNSALPIMAGALLVSEGVTTLRNVPDLRDIRVMRKLLEQLGAVVSASDDNTTITIDATNLTSHIAPYELVSQMRGAFVSLGPLYARLGEAKVSLPGGCSLGSRPVDYHIKGLRAMGAEVSEDGGYVIAKRPANRKSNDSIVTFDRQSHTGTENIMFAAALGEGKTTIINAACDPEVIDVANFLNAAGAKISGAGTGEMTVDAVTSLQGIEHTVDGDRLVAGTYLFAVAATGGDVEVSGFDPNHLTLVLEKLVEMGCEIEKRANGVKILAKKRLRAVNIVTCPFPGFPTDLQACAVAAMTVAEGVSRMKETVFDDRFGHAMEMRRLGAEISVSSDEALITGVAKLRGAEVMAGDIRAGAGLVIACLASEKQSVINRVYHIDRGYAQIEERFQSLGADIKREG
ncbi:UDP-N-acetylglucosamine 1-carboxyvinyltransferase [Gemmatimonas aurantiaca]|nr:UDP-N-acetylglucosamine 1-carboxyvinyltransferase [Gemmatimonas aurantiaca]